MTKRTEEGTDRRADSTWDYSLSTCLGAHGGVGGGPHKTILPVGLEREKGRIRRGGKKEKKKRKRRLGEKGDGG